MSRQLHGELVLDAGAELGEGPVWDHERRVLWWVDIEGRRINRFDPESGETASIEVPSKVGAVSIRTSGGLIAALKDGFATVSPDGKVTELASVEHADLNDRMNDGKCDSSGRFWAGSMSDSGRGALYRLDNDGTVSTMLRDVAISNGIAWTSDDATMYYIDTLTRCVDAFDFDHASGSIANRRTVVELAPPAYPDGMTIDEQGFLWVALWDGWGVHRYSPSGELDLVVRLPAAHVTSCTFGGDDLDVLYVTTARMGLDPEQLEAQPLAGGLFALSPGVRGTRAHAFAG